MISVFSQTLYLEFFHTFISISLQLIKPLSHFAIGKLSSRLKTEKKPGLLGPYRKTLESFF